VGWRSMGGYPTFGGSAPVGTQTGATTATVAHAIPSGIGNDPFEGGWTYTAETSVSPYTVWTSRTISGSVVAGADVTHTITGLTTATTYKARITAEGSNGLSATSAESNTFTTA
jgi:hypothetical protein